MRAESEVIVAKVLRGIQELGAAMLLRVSRVLLAPSTLAQGKRVLTRLDLSLDV